MTQHLLNERSKFALEMHQVLATNKGGGYGKEGKEGASQIRIKKASQITDWLSTHN